MSKFQLIEPYKNYSGKQNKDSDEVFRTRNGRTHSYVIMHPNERPHNEAQKAHTSLFGQVSQQIRTEMQDPHKRAQWEARYQQYRKEHKKELDFLKTANSNDLQGYSSRKKPVITSLRGFMFHELFEAANH
ncbi:MAG: hypothetical protein MJZ84_03685 [Paludibacteraceae bacterium]|nr:hypothetical protein [Paludibacteraceae bacterium]